MKSLLRLSPLLHPYRMQVFLSLLTLIGFTLVYAALMVATIYLLVKYARQAPPPLDSQAPVAAAEPTPSLVGAQD